MKYFIKAWSENFDDVKYPREFYFLSLESIKNSSSSKDLAINIVNMLYWKDGKISREQSNSAESIAIQIGDLIFHRENCKPNTYNEEVHWNTIASEEFYIWAKRIISSSIFNSATINQLREDRFKLWKDNSIVIPSFLLHILAPKIYPLFDQHVFRAVYLP